MKKITSYLMLVLLVIGLSSCDEFLDVNKNVDAPDQESVDAGLYLPGILSAYQGFYWDIRALGPLSQMMGSSSYSNFAANYYSSGSDAGGELWRMTYWLQGMNLENMINQSIEEEAWTLAGIGYAIKAFSWDCLTKYHGEAPMKQAYEPGRLSHDYDYQPEIMSQVRDWAEQAIEYLEKNDETEYGDYLKKGDLVYHGDKAKWLKFAHSVIVTDLAALSNKKDFVSAYAPDLIRHAALAINSNADNFAVERIGGGADAQFGTYNNFWGTARQNLTNGYWQSDFIVQIMTGTVPQYDEATGDKVDAENPTNRSNWELNPNQIICDTTKAAGHYDPRAAAKLSTVDGQRYDQMTDKEAIKNWIFYGSGFTGAAGPMGTAPNLYGFRAATPNVAVEGSGRWLFRDDAPYIILTAAEIQFEVAEAYWKMGDKAAALDAFKKGVALDMEFTGNYLNPGKPGEGNPVGGGLPGGSLIAKATYSELADEYLNGPYVNGLSLSDFTLSHIMMQKYVALWPWGALEAWTDLRKYQYDIKYTGDYPTKGNGWEQGLVNQKWDTDPTKVYKGFYLAPAPVEGRRGAYNVKNEGSPCYRVRPRYNSEYMWNLKSLKALKPIAGDADNYQCSMPWFAYPGDYPDSL
ncbi:MAG: SusD/RagB family nutrient-binding outer membrane lipoprotein [Bacteroidales bacterium]|nr:SusD/RagB family nutrient-binding outer membrane lipoprotein [Bacteroidales bacterium]